MALPPYVLATPCRDERDTLPGLLSALEAQTHSPALWLVVDDGSTDGSWEWLVEHAAERPWMIVARAPEAATEYLGAHVARIKRWGLEEVSQRLVARGTSPAHVGILDADMIVPPDHYERLAAALDGDPLLGVVSSLVCTLDPDGNEVVETWQRDDLPRGATQFFRRECLDSIGGLPPFPGYDGAANVKARLRGWRCKLLTDVRVLHTRETATRFGAAAGYARKGRYAWFLGLNPLLVAARTAAYAARPPREAAAHFARAWLRDAVTGAERCPDPEIRAYYGRERLLEYVRGALGRGGPRFG